MITMLPIDYNSNMQPNTVFFTALTSMLTALAGTPLYVRALIARKKPEIPTSPARRFLPILLPYALSMLVWALSYGLSGYSFAKSTWGVFLLLTPTYLLSNALLVFAQSQMLFLLTAAAELAALLIGVQVAAWRRGRRLSLRPLRKTFAFGLVAVLVVDGAVFLQLDQRSQTHVLPLVAPDKIGSEFERYRHVPFSSDNELEVPLETPDVMIRSPYPRLNGSTMTAPVYGAVAQALYQGLDDSSSLGIVSDHGAAYAYEQLLAGEKDVFFGAEPSPEQREAAANAGHELDMTVFGREALVIIVHKDNPVDSLTLEQVRAIYQKCITNWAEVGGSNEKIMLFQRPEDSEAQAVMLTQVMRGAPMATPLLEERTASFNSVEDVAAEYRNFNAAIGYGLRYYCTKTKGSEGVKLLAVGGVEPSVESIRDGSYPLVVDLCAVTAGTANPNVPVLLGWLQSPQGQAFVEQCGYVGTVRSTLSSRP
jgi:phosphate transport system substrate-binding protein